MSPQSAASRTTAACRSGSRWRYSRLRSGYAVWSNAEVPIPRGFAYALLDAGPDTRIACFSIHLKSNFARDNTEFENQKNIYKREAAAAQILIVVRLLGEKYGLALRLK